MVTCHGYSEKSSKLSNGNAYIFYKEVIFIEKNHKKYRDGTCSTKSTTKRKSEKCYGVH